MASNATAPNVGGHARTAQDGFDPAYFPQLFAIEDRHFWFRVRSRIITRLVARLTGGLAPGYRVLEVGCGTGSVLRALADGCRSGTCVGMDLFGEGLRFAKRRTACALVQGDMNAPPFRSQFHIVGLFDSLEHIPDDVGALRSLRSLIAPGGALILTVPARASLWSYFDEASHHCRRYEQRDLHDRLTTAGYQVEYLTHYMAALFPLVWCGRRLQALLARRRAPKGAWVDALTARDLQVTPVLNRVMEVLLAPETYAVTHGYRLPIGTSLLAVARRPQTEGQGE